MIGALIFGAFGWDTLFVVYSVALFVAAAMWLFIDPTRPFYERASSLNTHEGQAAAMAVGAAAALPGEAAGADSAGADVADPVAVATLIDAVSP